MQCQKCSKGRCHLMSVRVYIYDPPKVISFYETQEWCLTCVVGSGNLDRYYSAAVWGA